MKTIEIVVRGYHLDVFGHVNNARYLEFLEEARWAIFDKSIDALIKKEWSLNIVNLNINYRLATYLGQCLLIDAKIARIGHKSFTVSQAIRLKSTDDIMADAQIICVVTDNKTGASLPFENELKEIFNLNMTDAIE